MARARRVSPLGTRSPAPGLTITAGLADGLWRLTDRPCLLSEAWSGPPGTIHYTVTTPLARHGLVSVDDHMVRLTPKGRDLAAWCQIHGWW